MSSQLTSNWPKYCAILLSNCREWRNKACTLENYAISLSGKETLRNELKNLTRN